MLSKAFEWLRAADLKPDNDMVISRTKAAGDFVDRIRKSKDYALMVGSVAASVGGCERLGDQSPVVATLLECVRAQQPAFPGALSENALHLRMVCCLALGELLAPTAKEPNDDELMAASLLVAGLGVKPKEVGRHLDIVLAELGAVARSNLQLQAVALRQRKDLDWNDFQGLTEIAGDPPSFNQKLVPVLRKIIETLEKRSQCDREELEVMWWLYNGFSDHLGKPVKQASPHLAAAAIGCEVADRVAPPATAGLNELVAQAAVRERTATQSKAKALEKVVADLGDTGRKLLLPKDESVKIFIRGAAPLLPLTWLCIRLEESQGATGWEAELRAKTGLVADWELTPSELAVQVFMERQAQRVYQSLAGE